MTWKEFFLLFLKLLSFDVLLGFWSYILWRFIDLKYFSSLDITTLKEENAYLRKENKKINGSSEFWNESDIK